MLTAIDVEQKLQAFYDARETERPYHVTETVLLDSGFEAVIFAFVLQSAGNVQNSENLVLRIYAGDGASEKAKREFDAMLRLGDIGYPVPRVHVLQQELWPFGQPFIIMEQIPGVSLLSVYWSASEDERRKQQTLHFRLMADLHALDGPSLFSDSPLAAANNPDVFLDQELAMLSAQFAQLGDHAPPSLRDALAWLEDRSGMISCERLVVIHGDFHRNNILLCPDDSSFVIDWSNVRLADYRTDLAWTLLIGRLISHVAHLPDHSESEWRMYESLTGVAVSDLEYYEVIACLRLLLSVLLSLRFGVAKQGLRPETEARMRKEGDGNRYVARLLQEWTGLAMPDLEDALLDR